MDEDMPIDVLSTESILANLALHSSQSDDAVDANNDDYWAETSQMTASGCKHWTQGSSTRYGTNDQALNYWNENSLPAYKRRSYWDERKHTRSYSDYYWAA